MSNNLIRKIIMILIILLLITVFIITLIYCLKKDNTSKISEDGDNPLEFYGKGLGTGIDSQAYFDIKECMQKYIDNINTNNTKYYFTTKAQNEIDQEIKQEIYKLLSNKFIKQNNITINNLYDYVKTIDESATYLPLEASLINDSDIKTFVVCGLIQSTQNFEVISKLFSIVNIDMINNRFSIEPIYGNYESIEEIKIDKLEEKIEDRIENKYRSAYIKNEDYPKEYIEIYKKLAFGDPDRLYNLLDTEYRDLRFKDKQDFIKYIEKNKEKIFSVRLEKYRTDNENNKNRYICIDQFDNYYVFTEEESLQNYIIMLDTYTIDLPEFIVKYENSADNLKVALNIEKLVEATKMGDYKYIYNKLDESFKTNNFKTVSAFEKFMQGKFDAREDTIKYDKYEKVTRVHVYNIVVTDTSENKTINAKVVMDLKENRDFVFSFSVEN